MGEDAITELEQLLKEEREAIRQLDAARVLVYAERKESLVRTLRQGEARAEDGRGGQTLSHANAARLRALAPALRHNSILLAHARDVLRDALVVARGVPQAGALSRARPAGTVARLLSVRG